MLLLLAPFAPHMTEEIWQSLLSTDNKNNDSFSSIHQQNFPVYEQTYLVEDEVSIIVQVNGKMRDQLQITNYELRMKEKVEDKARELEKVKKYIENKGIKKIIYVEGKVINFVI